MKKIIRITAAFILGSAVFSTSANLIENGSFENDTLSDGNTKKWEVFQQLDGGWNTVTGRGIELQMGNIGGIGPQSGDYKVELDSDTRNGGGAGSGSTNTLMAQLVQGLTVGATYTLDFWYSARINGDINTNGIEVFAGASIPFSASDSILSVNSDVVGWVNYSVSFEASNASMYVGFGAFGDADTLGGYIDNVSLVSEPTTVSVFGAMLLGMCGLRRRFKK